MNFEMPSQAASQETPTEESQQRNAEAEQVESEKSFAPTFDDAVEAYLDAPFYGESREDIQRVGEGEFNWGRNNIVISITPDKVEMPEDEYGPRPDVKWAENARTFALDMQELWEKLPVAARRPECLTALAIARRSVEW